jgi:hypothetical protein
MVKHKSHTPTKATKARLEKQNTNNRKKTKNIALLLY